MNEDPSGTPAAALSKAQNTLEETRVKEHPHCVLCSQDNPIGLALDFHVIRPGVVRAVFPCAQHLQSYPGILHGGIISAFMDTAMANCLFSLGEVAVTAEMTVRYLKPTRLDIQAEIIGEMQKSMWPFFYVKAELRQEGMTLVRAEAKFIDRRSATGG